MRTAHALRGNPPRASQRGGAPPDRKRFRSHPSLKARGRSFKKGRSGNPAGRPKGARNRTTLAAEALLEGQAEAITQKVVDMALEGDLTAARMCLDRILPVRRERRVRFDLPPINSAEDVANAMRAIAAALAFGELSPSEAAEVGSFVGWHAKAIEVFELEQRIKLLEQDHPSAARDAPHYDAVMQRTESHVNLLARLTKNSG